MSVASNVPSTGLLSPSELVLLHGDQFAAPARLSNTVQLLHTDAKVSAEQLARAILASAFLACEHKGCANLQTRKKKALMGLRKVDALYVEPTKHAAAWPENSLESSLLKLAQGLQAGDKGSEVSDVIYAWLGADSSVPWRTAVELVQQGLTGRGHLERAERKKLKIFSATEYQLPEDTMSLIGESSVAQVRSLLAACEKDRPELWKLLQKQIKDAVDRRTEDYDSDF
jgi:hypothetical protein